MNPGWFRRRLPFFAVIFVAVGMWFMALGWGLWRELTPRRSWEAEVARFERLDLTNPPPEEAVLFVGSSSIKLWETLRADFPRYRVFRRGFGGAHMEDVVKYAERVILPYDLEMIVVHAGGNDIAAGKQPSEVVKEFKKLVRIIRRADPKIHIAFLSLKPSPSRWPLREELADVNRRIKAFADTDERVVFIDIYDKMISPKGEPRPELFAEDGLHLNTLGYRIWADAIRPVLPKTARKKVDGIPRALATVPVPGPTNISRPD